MKKEIVVADEARGIIRVTTVDERWYARPAADPVTGLPTTYTYIPSVTWIGHHYPKGIAYHKWLAQHGWDEAVAIREAAADKGSKVHQAVAALLDGRRVALTDAFVNPSTGHPEELTLAEYDCLLAFAAWHAETQPTFVAKDFVVWADDDAYAGTVDLLCRIGSRVWLVDFKTSQYVWPEHRIQVTAYRDALPPALLCGEPREAVGLAILQLGYRGNRRKWKWTPVTPVPELFQAARAIWAEETAGAQPYQRDYPLTIQLTRPVPPATNGTAHAPTNGAPPPQAAADLGALLTASVVAAAAEPESPASEPEPPLTVATVFDAIKAAATVPACARLEHRLSAPASFLHALPAASAKLIRAALKKRRRELAPRPEEALHA